MTHTSNEIHSLLLNCLTYPVPLGTAEACSALVEAEWQELQEIARIPTHFCVVAQSPSPI